ncbi:MAG: hypothetical protein EOM24_02860, partial [Chloroflexia bacterium]|nr:hypothetical protein [Chloroflexia bacterium]
MVPGTSIAKTPYVIEELLARGGMGEVYRALDQRTGLPVALKLVRATRRQLHEAFQREARLLAALAHPALPRWLDQFQTEHGLWLVMEFVPGDDLATLLLTQGGPFPVPTVLTWARELLDVLIYLHRQTPPVIHRDLKPANLKLAANGALMLLDFGLAKGGQDQTTLHASLPGYTLAYAPLEQIRGEGTGPQSDLYALGATLYDLLTGGRPPDALQRVAALLEGQPDPLRFASELNPALPPGLASLLHQALALRPEDRPPDAATMRAALDDPALVQRAPLAELALTPVPNNLPVPPTPLLGRSTELAALRALLMRPEVRLVTLTGMGGIGKSRLALEALA